jgi:outer membrane protein assembly factor BamB
MILAMLKKIFLVGCILFLPLSLTAPLIASNWLTFGHDPQRSGWAFDEDTLSPQTAAHLELKWKAQLDNQPLSLTALTAPLVADGITTPEGVKTLVYVAGSSNRVFALDASTGKVVWKVDFESHVQPKDEGMWLCPNNLNATPVIDKGAGLIYVLASDGRLYGLDLGTGKRRFGPVQFVPAYAKAWSLNLVEGVIYTSISQGCGGAESGIYSMDIRDPRRPVIRDLLVSKGGSAGIWGRGGPVAGENQRIYVATGDGLLDPSTGQYGSTVLAASMPDLKVVDRYTPVDFRDLTKFDLDLGSTSPAWFAHGNFHLLAAGGKGGTLYFLNADLLGDKDHQTPLQVLRLANDQRAYEEYGIWGAFATWSDEEGAAWLYVPVWGPASKKAPHFPLAHGPTQDGSIMAFKVGLDRATGKPVLDPEWISNDFNRPDPPAIANGVLFALSTGENAQQTLGARVVSAPGHYGKRILSDQERREHASHAILYALDARTGKVLYQSEDAITGWTHFSGLAVADGQVYVVDHDSRVYCFGLKKAE